MPREEIKEYERATAEMGPEEERGTREKKRKA